jgi:branched-subunit amino acid aminotransferase/4-amino-4-deoxychorismate lyase
MQGNNYFAYVNGTFMPYLAASLHINDRGLKFGDGVYETVRVANGQLFCFPKHLERLEISLNLLKIHADISGLAKISKVLLQKNNIVQGTLRIMITRGIGGTGYLPGRENECGIVIEALPLPKIPENPIDLYLSNWRKIPPVCLPAAAKTMQGLSSTLARMEAEENGCFEAVLLSIESNICECSSSNIFWVKDDRLYTPSLSSGILAGTTRDNIIELWPAGVIEGIFPLNALEAADEVFVTNVVWTALPVRKLLPNNIEYKGNWVCQQVKDMLMQEIQQRK